MTVPPGAGVPSDGIAPSAWRCRRLPLVRRYFVTLLNYIGIAALVALGLVLLTGVGGLTSFGQAAFVGVGAYATAWLTTTRAARPGSALCSRWR